MNEQNESVIWLNLKVTDAMKFEMLLKGIKAVWEKSQDALETTPISPYDREFFSARYHLWTSINEMEKLLGRIIVED